MTKTSRRLTNPVAVGTMVLASLVFAVTTGPVSHANQESAPLPTVPMSLPHPEANGVIYLTQPDGRPRATTIVPELQAHLDSYLIDSRSPIAAVLVVDAKTGSILAMSQGRAAEEWGAKTHTALHSGFPAASLFKTVVTAAAFEVADLDGMAPLGLNGGCAHVRESGVWLKERVTSDLNRMTLRRAYGVSCNGFFAKIAVNYLGLGPIMTFARKFGWETGVPADFHVDKSPFMPPAAETSSTHTIGRFAAGFGYVGINTAHAAWMMLTIANQGAPVPLRLFRDTPLPDPSRQTERLYSVDTATRLTEIMASTVRGGTASFAFRRGKHRKLRDIVGGKTGTLTGRSPHGLTTWFAGMAPLDDPEIIVASVVVLDTLWHIKGPHLAAEAIWAYFDQKRRNPAPTVSTLLAPDLTSTVEPVVMPQ